jgi:hypothetical protein
MNVLTGQPLGGTSYHPGFVDIFLDRRLLQDDSRGLGQGVTDNLRTKEVFKIAFEGRPQESLKPSLRVQEELMSLLHLPFTMLSTQSTPLTEVHLMQKSLPCGQHLLNLRSRETLSEFYATFHNLPISCDTACPERNNVLKLNSIFTADVLDRVDAKINLTSLSQMHVLKANVSLQDDLVVEESDFATVALKTRK